MIASSCGVYARGSPISRYRSIMGRQTRREDRPFIIKLLYWAMSKVSRLVFMSTINDGVDAAVPIAKQAGLNLTSGNLTMPVAHTAEIRDEDRERISGGMNGTWCMIIGMVAMT
jgi:hypothetical protein